MRLQFVSDIHLELRDLEPYESIINPRAEMLALLGDIGIPDERLEKFLKWCSTHFEYVFYVPGNHEYYNTLGISIDKLNKQLQEICDRSKVIFMNNHVCVVGKFAIIGSPLWSFIPPDKYEIIENSLNDYKFIYQNTNQKLTPEFTSKEFEKNIEFIASSIKDMHRDQKTIIVLTHHVPVLNGTSHPRYDNMPTNHAFATNISHLPHHIQYWLCGHTHHNFHIKTPYFRLMSNQWGYGTTPEEFYNPNLVIHL